MKNGTHKQLSEIELHTSCHVFTTVAQVISEIFYTPTDADRDTHGGGG